METEDAVLAAVLVKEAVEVDDEVSDTEEVGEGRAHGGLSAGTYSSA